MILDARVGFERNQFASQLNKLAPDVLKNLSQSFANNETPEYYEGLLTGFVNAYALLHQLPNEQGKAFIGACAAYTASLTL